MGSGSLTLLAEFAAGLTFEELPKGVIAHAKLAMLDTLGCGLFGSTLPWSQIVQATLAATQPGASSTVWGAPLRSTAAGAALANGTAVHGFELDDLHPASILHPGSVVVSAALAVADELGGVCGRDLITAIVAGYEVATRVGMSVGSAHLLQGWHPTGTHGTVGAGTAAARLLGADARQLEAAISLAATQSAGLMAAQFGGMAKRLHAGRAAQSGVYAAQLAVRGFTGIDDVFEAPYGGYCRTFSPRQHAEHLVAGLGKSWETCRIGFKPYCTNGSCHPVIDALLDLRSSERLCVDDVAEVEIAVSTATKQHVGWDYEPASVTTAQMNLPYIVAVVLTDGAASVEQFTDARIRDPLLLELSRRVRVHAAADIDARGDQARHAMRLTVRMRDGRAHSDAREFARGSARRPLSAGEVRAKFTSLSSTVLSPGEVAELGAVVDSLQTRASDQLTSRLEVAFPVT